MESEHQPDSETQPGGLPPLTPVEARIIGCLIEKELTVPDTYPLTLNSLVAACNQSSNRDPVMSLDEGTVRDALETLKTRNWVFQVTLAGARVQKFKHNIQGKLPRLNKPGVALLAVLLLRGIQTLGELRQRTDRLQTFPDLESVEAQMKQLLTYPEGAVAVCLPAGGGRRVPAYAQTLTGPVSMASAEEYQVVPSVAAPAAPAIDADWKEKVERELDELRAELARIKTSLGMPD